MTETAQAARANRHGDPCPPWCETQHHQELRHMPGTWNDAHQHRTATIRTATTDARASAYRAPGPAAPAMVIVASARYDDDSESADGHVLLERARHAEHLARVIDALAGLAPEQLRELAAGIRAAAAEAGLR